MSRKHRHAEGHGPLLDREAERTSAPTVGRPAVVPRQRAMVGKGAMAPRVEPSTNGANQWTGGRRNKRKAH